MVMYALHAKWSTCEHLAPLKYWRVTVATYVIDYMAMVKCATLVPCEWSVKSDDVVLFLPQTTA